MTPQQIEAMKLALEALELINIEFVCGNGSHHKKEDRHEWDEDCPITNRWRKAITALEEALAQPEQEPVVHDPLPRACNLAGVDYQTFLKIKAYMPVAPPQPEQNPMSDEMLQAITDPENQPSQYGTVTLDYHFEKIKKWEDLFERMSNKVLQQLEQEPVAIERMKEWIEYLKYLKRTSDQHMKIPSEMSAGTCWELALELEQFINTTPPQRTWVGLTDEDMYVVSEEESCSFIAGAKWSEEILKEKNAICSPFMISELWRLNK
jgi:hypothetical protein